MAVNIKQHSMQLRRLCEEYYRNIITYEAFRRERNLLFDAIDREQGLQAFQFQNSGEDDKDVVFGQEIQLTQE